MNAIEEFRSKMAAAKQAQAASGQNGNLRDHVGEMMVVTGMHITEGIEIDNLVLDKITFFLADGTALDGFHEAAVDKAEELIAVLGEGPYPLPLLMEIREVETKRGPKQFGHLIDFAGTPSEVAFAELEAPDITPEPPAAPQTPDQTPEQLASFQPEQPPAKPLTARQERAAAAKAAKGK